MDTGKDGRNAYLELMAKLGDRFKKQKWGWSWAPALAQPELEKALQVGGFGYPVSNVDTEIILFTELCFECCLFKK